MELYLMNKSFETISVIDKFKSLIWTDRYNELGDFEIVPSDLGILDVVQKDFYASIRESDRLMIVDNISGSDDSEEGPSITISGHSSEVILKRRIVWDSFSYYGPLQGGVRTLMIDNIIDPKIAARRIPNLGFSYNVDLTKYYGISFDELIGDELFDVIKSSCDLYDVGFRILYHGDESFSFELYEGVDRSYTQTERPVVVFSPELDNLKNTNFQDNNEEYKNVIYAVAENEYPILADGSEPETIKFAIGDHSGIERREAYLSVDIDEEYAYVKEDYVKQQARSALKDYQSNPMYDGEIVQTGSYELNKDYFLGDIVEVRDRFGNESRSRITEIIYSQDSSGCNVYPTFTKVD